MEEKTKVVSKDSFSTVIALAPIRAGETILHIAGTRASAPSKYSIQVSANEHLLPYSSSPDDVRSRWRFLNHSCNPNAFIDPGKMELVALRDIAGEEEIRFNYNQTEYEMASPFVCNCGETNCLGEIKGFRYLTEEKQKELSALPLSSLKSFSKKIKL